MLQSRSPARLRRYLYPPSEWPLQMSHAPPSPRADAGWQEVALDSDIVEEPIDDTPRRCIRFDSIACSSTIHSATAESQQSEAAGIVGTDYFVRIAGT